MMVSMKTLRARDPDHRASTKPSEMTSNRPPRRTLLSVGSMMRVDGPVSEQPAREVQHRRADLVDLSRVQLIGDVADRPGQGEDQRRHGQHGEERGLGRQARDPVAEAAARCRDHEPPHEATGPVQPVGHQPLLGHHVSYGIRMADSHPAGIRSAANQVPLLAGHNVVTADAALSEAVARHAGPEVLESLVAIGAEAGTEEAREHGRLANEHHPELRQYDRYGHRVDEVDFHPSWHWLMERAIGHGLAATPWERQADGDPHAHVRRAAGFMAWSHTEPGHGCPVSHDLRRHPGTARRRRHRQGVDAPAGVDDLRPGPPGPRRPRPGSWPAWE